MVSVKDSLVDKILQQSKIRQINKIHRQNFASIIYEICARFLRIRGVRCDNVIQSMLCGGCLAQSPGGIYLPVSCSKYQTRSCNHAFITINIQSVIRYHALDDFADDIS